MRWGRVSRSPPTGLSAGQGADPPMSVTRTWGHPCSGVRIQAARPYPADGPLWFTDQTSSLRGDRWFGTLLTMEWSQSGEALLDLAGPYRNWRWNETDGQVEIFDEDYRNRGSDFPVLDINISDWQIQATGSVVRHLIEIAWPESAEASLRFRSEDDACDGEPLVVCNLSGCELRR